VTLDASGASWPWRIDGPSRDGQTAELAPGRGRGRRASRHLDGRDLKHSFFTTARYVGDEWDLDPLTGQKEAARDLERIAERASAGTIEAEVRTGSGADALHYAAEIGATRPWMRHGDVDSTSSDGSGWGQEPD